MDVLLHAAWHAPQLLRYEDIWCWRDTAREPLAPSYRPRQRRVLRWLSALRRAVSEVRS
jgi:hypothetical protein